MIELKIIGNNKSSLDKIGQLILENKLGYCYFLNECVNAQFLNEKHENFRHILTIITKSLLFDNIETLVNKEVSSNLIFYATPITAMNKETSKEVIQQTIFD